MPGDDHWPGAVRYQREEHWCDGCRAVVPHLRAVRAADGWHADWTCCALALTGGHAPDPLDALMEWFYANGQDSIAEALSRLRRIIVNSPDTDIMAAAVKAKDYAISLAPTAQPYGDKDKHAARAEHEAFARQIPRAAVASSVLGSTPWLTGGHAPDLLDVLKEWFYAHGQDSIAEALSRLRRTIVNSHPFDTSPDTDIMAAAVKAKDYAISLAPTAQPYGDKDKHAARAEHEAFARQIPRAAVALSVLGSTPWRWRIPS